jgi:hypothetical protein
VWSLFRFRCSCIIASSRLIRTNQSDFIVSTCVRRSRLVQETQEWVDRAGLHHVAARPVRTFLHPSLSDVPTLHGAMTKPSQNPSAHPPLATEDATDDGMHVPKRHRLVLSDGQQAPSGVGNGGGEDLDRDLISRTSSGRNSRERHLPPPYQRGRTHAGALPPVAPPLAITHGTAQPRGQY